MRSRSFSPASAVHVVRGEMAASVLKRAGYSAVAVDDELSYGPSSPDPTLHGAVRMSFWADQREEGHDYAHRRDLSLDDVVLDSDALSKALPNAHDAGAVIVWSSAYWPDVLFRWWAIDALMRHPVKGRTHWVAVPNAEWKWPGGLTEAEVVADCRYSLVSLPLANRAAAAWRAFASKSPQWLATPEKRRRLLTPKDRKTAWFYGAVLPRIARAGGHLGLSIIDEWLLSKFCEWRSLSDVFRASTFPQDFWPILNLGESLLYSRLASWSKQGGGVFMNTQAADSKRPSDERHRLTDEGRLLLERGLARIDDSPPVQVGGYSSAGQSALWALSEHRNYWTLERIRIGTGACRA
jgi:hypothetical protein